MIVITSLHFVRHKIEQEAEDRLYIETSHCIAQLNNKDNVSQHMCLVFKKKRVWHFRVETCSVL